MIFNKIKMVFTMVLLITCIGFGQTKLAQTGFNFLEVSSDARVNGMGDAGTALPGYSGALFYNPAGIADVDGMFSAKFSMNRWIADINHLTGSLTINPDNGAYGVFGLTIQSVDYGELQGTRISQTGSDYIDTEMFSPTAMAVGFGYAKMLNDQFSVGGQVRYVYQKLGQSLIPVGDGTEMKDNEASTVAYDFGTLFRTGYRTICFGMSIRNYSSEVEFEEESFQLPMLFTLGISADVFQLFDLKVPGPEQSLLLAIDATHPRAHPEQVKIGIEYTFDKMLKLRAGHVTANSEDSFTFGAGFIFSGAEIDYAYTPFGVFDSVQRFTASFTF